MFKAHLVPAALSLATIGMVSTAQVKVTRDQAQNKVDVTIDGAPFTSYLWSTGQKKPVLFPLITSNGVTVTRGFPLAPREKERVDHPHHAGMWFNYGNVNGFDFWNNSDAIPEAQRLKMGTIHQERIVSTMSGKDRGELTVQSVWTSGAGQDILRQNTRYIFSRQGTNRIVDQVVTLTALGRAVFNDDKEGLLGIRVAHFLESPTEKGGMFMDASGRPTKVDAPDTTGASGVYRTSEGIQGDAVWSTRGTWCALTGSTEGKTVTVAILDHTGNPGYPTYWHARGYGLFAANALGDHIFDAKAKPHNFTLEKGSSATFRYRVILFDHAATPAEMNKAKDVFEREYK
ncbi:MAG: PmoA family protein [Janthinobacterium lividum]